MIQVTCPVGSRDTLIEAVECQEKLLCVITQIVDPFTQELVNSEADQKVSETFR